MMPKRIWLAVMIIGIGGALLAAVLKPSDLLPSSSAVAGYAEVKNSCKAGAIDDASAYECYNGDAPSMKDDGIVRFARKLYENKKLKRYATIDVYEFKDDKTASKYYSNRISGAKAIGKPVSFKIGKRNAFYAPGSTTIGGASGSKFYIDATITAAAKENGVKDMKSFLTASMKKLK